MARWLSLAIFNAVGIPWTYSLNRRFTAQRFRKGSDANLPRRSSWLFASVVWCDVDVLMVILVFLHGSFWITSVTWLVFNAIVIVGIVRRKIGLTERMNRDGFPGD